MPRSRCQSAWIAAEAVVGTNNSAEHMAVASERRMETSWGRGPTQPNPPGEGRGRVASGEATRPLGGRVLRRYPLQVVGQGELVRVRTQPHGVELVDPLVLDPGVDHVLGEHTALEQPLVVALERVQDFLERTGHLLDMRLLLRRQVVQVLVH